MRDGSYRPAPDVWDGMPVSGDSFQSLSRPPGWKYECWDGRLRIEPDWRYQVARWTQTLRRPAGRLTNVSIHPPAARDLDDLANVADISFENGPDFFRWPLDKRRASLRQSVEDALTLEPDWVLSAHQVAWDRSGVAVGLLLVREVEGGVTLETVGVRPGRRRAGLAAEMFRSAARALPVGTEVRSAWLVANRESAAWHQRVGFETIPTSVSARSALRAAQWTDRTGIASETRQAAEAEIRQLEEDERAGRAPDPFTRPIHCGPSA